jgi:hypothetical protein
MDYEEVREELLLYRCAFSGLQFTVYSLRLYFIARHADGKEKQSFIFSKYSALSAISPCSLRCFFFEVSGIAEITEDSLRTRRRS